MLSLVGSVLGGRYEIIEKIGEGGMATVYKAKCKLLNRYVAVKVLKDEFSRDSQFVKRFRAEAQSAASLTHPNIVSVYDVGEENGINYIVMECLEGKTLKDYIEKNGKLDNLTTLKFASQIASALEAAHKAKIIHRDIKPQNIVFSNNGNIVKVTDFGIAKMTTTNTITSQKATMGSVHYFSPEHAKGCYIDEKSDIYSLGVVMYEMATGRLPFDADTAVSVALKQIQEEPIEPIKIDPNISEDLNRIIMKAMQKAAPNRYSSATSMLDDIFAAINNPGHIFKSEPKVIAGGTQIIPIIGLKNSDAPSIGDVEHNSSIESRKLARQSYTNNNEAEDKNVEEKDTDVKENIYEDGNDKNDLTPEEQKQRKKKIIIIVSIISVICLTVIIILTVKLISTFNEQNNTKTEVGVKSVPDLVGKNFEEVKEQYDILGYKIELDKYEYSSEVENGCIISQSQEKGKKVVEPTITVVVSKGKKLVTMIDVLGKDYTVAKYELDSLGLVPVFEFEKDEKIEKNIIKEQSISAKEEVAVGTTVNIIVSEGNGKVTVIMPNVVGDKSEAAKKELQGLKLNVSLEYSADTTKADGVVLKQSQKENAEIEEGDLITLTINRLQKTKNVQLDLSGYISNIATDTLSLKVEATVEGVTNIIYPEKTISKTDVITVPVSGFTTAELTIYIDGVKAGTQSVTF